MFNNVQLFSNNISKQLINMSTETMYILDIQGTQYQTMGIYENFIHTLGEFIQVVTKQDGDILYTERFMQPKKNNPMFIRSMSIVCYRSQEDLDADIAKYGDSKAVVRAYLADEVGILQGYGKTVINMSNNEYFVIDGNKILEVPKCDEFFKNQFLNDQDLTNYDNDDKDLLVIYTHVNGKSQNKIHLNITNTTVRWVKKFSKNESDPIILDDQNLVVFNNRYAAKEFLDKYSGKVHEYYIHLADVLTRDKHLEDMRNVAEEYKHDKMAIAKTAGLMAASTAVGALVKWLLDKVFSSNPVTRIGWGMLRGHVMGISDTHVIWDKIVKRIRFLEPIRNIFVNISEMLERVMNWGPIGLIRKAINWVVDGVMGIVKSVGGAILGFFSAIGSKFMGIFGYG
jgi:F0F1-type ATP synthase assembly protein I